MGWNEVCFVKENLMINNIERVTDFAGDFAWAVQNGNNYGTQFQPEKIHSCRERLLFNFAKL